MSHSTVSSRFVHARHMSEFHSFLCRNNMWHLSYFAYVAKPHWWNARSHVIIEALFKKRPQGCWSTGLPTALAGVAHPAWRDPFFLSKKVSSPLENSPHLPYLLWQTWKNNLEVEKRWYSIHFNLCLYLKGKEFFLICGYLQLCKSSECNEVPIKKFKNQS
jgi:hypothetical protein